MTIEDVLLRCFGWKALLLAQDPMVFARWRMFRRHLAAGGSRTLDVGCSSGHFTFFSASAGNPSIGIDHDSDAILRACAHKEVLQLDNVEFMTGDLRSLDKLRVGAFDQIICSEVMEHLLDDFKLIRDLSSLLTPEGRLLLTVPYKFHKPFRGERLSESEDGGHVRYGYSREDLHVLLSAHGLEILEEDAAGGYVSLRLHEVLSFFLRIFDFRVAYAAFLPFRLLQIFDGLITGLMRFPRYHIGIVARNARADSAE